MAQGSSYVVLTGKRVKNQQVFISAEIGTVFRISVYQIIILREETK